MEKQTPIDQCLRWEGAKLSVSNALDLLYMSCESSKCGKHGIAVALAVLSSEESTKAMALLAYVIESDLDSKGLDKYFSSHKHKHGAAFAISSAFRSFKALQDLVIRIQADETISASDKGHEMVRQLKDMADLIFKSNEVPSMLADLDKWRRSADHEKQKGLYVNYFNERWWTPSSMTNGDAVAFQEKAEELLDFVKPIVDIEFNDLKIILEMKK